MDERSPHHLGPPHCHPAPCPAHNWRWIIPPEPRHSPYRSRALLSVQAALCGGSEMVKAILPPSAAAPQCRMSTRETTRSATHHPSQLTSILPPQSRNNTLRSFPHSLITTWNQLPTTLLQSPPSRRGMHTFKKNINDHLRCSKWEWATDRL